jgi:SAM-dependent methyltransferase
VQFVEAQKYADSFGFQWSKYARAQLDDENSEIIFRRKTGFTPTELAGKLVRDVGCGMGRFAEVASRWGARVVGIDLSVAAEVAARNLANRDAVSIFQTPNCEQVFKALIAFLKPGGRMAIWLYSGYRKWYRLSDLYRKFTCRLPKRRLHASYHAAVPLYHVHGVLRRVPVIGRYASGRLSYFLPVSLHPKRDMRVLDTVDWYSPRYQSKHTYEEVFRWFESSGPDSLRVLYEPVAVQGRKSLGVLEAHLEEKPCAASQVS